jgi:small GTP-binding protein
MSMPPDCITLFRRPATHRVVLLGDAGVGKTALTYRLITNQYLDETDPIEDTYRIVLPSTNSPNNNNNNNNNSNDTTTDQSVLLEILDTAGAESFAHFRACHAMPTADAIILAFSLTDRRSFDGAAQELHELKTIARAYLQDKHRVILVATKSDAEQARQVSSAEALLFATSIDASFYIETSAVSGCNVRELFQDAVRCIDQYRHSHTHVKTTNERTKRCAVQ